LEAKIPVQPGGVVLLDHETVAARAGPRLTRRLRAGLKVALGAVGVELLAGHAALILPRFARRISPQWARGSGDHGKRPHCWVSAWPVALLRWPWPPCRGRTE